MSLLSRFSRKASEFKARIERDHPKGVLTDLIRFGLRTTTPLAWRVMVVELFLARCPEDILRKILCDDVFSVTVKRMAMEALLHRVIEDSTDDALREWTARILQQSEGQEREKTSSPQNPV